MYYKFKTEKTSLIAEKSRLTTEKNKTFQTLDNPLKKENNLNPALVLGEVGLVHSLSQAGVPVYVGCEGCKNPSVYSRYVTSSVLFSTYRSEKFIDELCEFGRSLDRKAVIFSDDDDALLTISNYRERLKKHFLFLFPEKDIVKKVLDKQEFIKLTKRYDLPVPASFSVSDRHELETSAQQCTFPCIIKPTYRSDWYHENFEQIVGSYKKAYCCANEDELLDLYKKISQISPKVVMQEYVPGEDPLHYSVNIYVDNKGEIRGHYIARKIRVYPIGAGMGSLVETIKDEKIFEKAADVIRKLELRGLLNIQFKRDCRTGEPKLLEIHFRNSVWGFLGVSAGINLYACYYHGLNGAELPASQEAEPGIKYVKLARDIPGFFQYHREGKLSFWDWLQTYRGKVVFGGFKVSDPVPFLMFWWLQLWELVKNIIFRQTETKEEQS